MIQVLIPPALLLLATITYWANGQPDWQGPSVAHPLGTDEFGRDMLATMCATLLLSGVKGSLLAFLAMTVGGAAGYAMAMLESKPLRWLVSQLSIVIESVPLFLWILVMVVALRSRVAVLVLGFTMGTLPLVSRVVAGEIERLGRQPFVEVARIFGASNFRIARRHILPNALSVVGPVAVQIAGAAVAADGVFGLVGFGNRTQLDVGTILLRGKENALLHPHLLLSAMALVGLLYLYFSNIYRLVDRSGAARPEMSTVA